MDPNPLLPNVAPMASLNSIPPPLASSVFPGGGGGGDGGGVLVDALRGFLTSPSAEGMPAASTAAPIPIRHPEEDDDDDEDDDEEEEEEEEGEDHEEDAVLEEDEITEEELDFYQASDPIGELLTHLTTIHR